MDSIKELKQQAYDALDCGRVLCHPNPVSVANKSPISGKLSDTLGASDSPKDVPDNDTIVDETHTLSKIDDSEMVLLENIGILSAKYQMVLLENRENVAITGITYNVVISYLMLVFLCISIVMAKSFSQILTLANLTEEVQVAYRRRIKLKRGDLADEASAPTE
ncbi:Phosphoenolpyruvate carboxylase [Artemisia annua]|uniref:Phosphoenolpyruvate carboxylase n=1 Tax=Artemisia annua TaxID=35608 RepID=A0A2U1LPP5_ARTAN|nr:Phosphoenolpyruvate carboxylase [Artemisia annua]